MKNRWEEEASSAVELTVPQAGQLCLYIAGPSPRAELAEANVRHCCATHFAGRYELQVIDLQQKPALAQHEQLLALPALVRQHPTPKRYLVGTLVDETKLLNGLAFGGNS